MVILKGEIYLQRGEMRGWNGEDLPNSVMG